MPQETKAEVSAAKRAPQSVTFRDTAFRSRTIVFADGNAGPVVAGLITVSRAEHIEHLSQLDEFERTDSGV